MGFLILGVLAASAHADLNKLTDPMKALVQNKLPASARELRVGEINDALLLRELTLADGETAEFLMKAKPGLNIGELRADLLRIATAGTPGRASVTIPTSQIVVDIVKQLGQLEANLLHDGFVGADALFLATAKHGSDEVKRVLGKHQLTYDSLLAGVKAVRNGSVNTPVSGEGTGALAKFIVRVTEQAGAGKLEAFVGPQTKIDDLANILGQQGRRTAVVTGPQGSGKTSLVHGLAQRMHQANSNLPAHLKNRELVSVNAAALHGLELDSDVLKELVELAKNPKKIIVIENVDVLLSLKNPHPGQASRGLRHLLEQIEIAGGNGAILTMRDETFEGLGNGADSDIAAMTTRITVKAPESAQSLAILRGKNLEGKLGISLTDGAKKSAVDWAKKYFEGESQITAALTLLDSAAQRVKHFKTLTEDQVFAELSKPVEQLKIQKQHLVQGGLQHPRDRFDLNELDTNLVPKAIALRDQKYLAYQRHVQLKAEREALKAQIASLELRRVGDPSVDAQITILNKEMGEISTQMIAFEKQCEYAADTVGNIQVAYEIQQKTSGRVPVVDLMMDFNEKLVTFERDFNKLVRGQPEAGKLMVRIARSRNSGATNVATLLGDTGTGKTETVLKFTDLVMGPSELELEKRIILLKGQEYKESHAAQSITGAPPGYTGYEDKTLVERMKACESKILFLDEAARAHPDLIEVLMTFIDGGTLTDKRGNFVSSKGWTIFLAANAKATPAEATPTQPYIGSIWSEALVGRLGTIITYNRLSEHDLAEIIRIKSRALIAEYRMDGIEVAIDDAVFGHLASLSNKAIDAELGARPAVKRVWPQQVVQLLETAKVTGQLGENMQVRVYLREIEAAQSVELKIHNPAAASPKEVALEIKPIELRSVTGVGGCAAPIAGQATP